MTSESDGAKVKLPRQSRELEILVAKIQRQLAPDAEVQHDVKLPGRISQRERQIDVLVRQPIGQYEMMIVLECKDHGRRVDVKGVEEFHGLLDDVGAHKGALVSPKGFSKAAKARAAAWKIDLYSPVDTDPHKWQAKVSVPAICDFRGARIALGFNCSMPMPFRLPEDFFSSSVARDPGDNAELGTPLSAALSRWNDGEFPTDPGEHRDLLPYGRDIVLVDNGYGQQLPVTITAHLFVERRLYFGSMPIQKISGFKDELSGKVISNVFTLGILDPNEIEKTWAAIASEADAPQTPVMILTGLIGYN